MNNLMRTAVPLASALALLAFGAAPQDFDSDHISRLDVLDFEGPPAGTIASGVTTRHGLGPVLVNGVNPSLGPTNAAVLFDSSDPTGGDSDLGTPNEDFGGPGEGDGGDAGSPYENRRTLGNLLIVAKDLNDADDDGLVDDPGDTNDPGARLELDFSAIGPITLKGITVVDVENANARLEAFDMLGEEMTEVPFPITGNNGAARIDLGSIQGVGSVVVHLGGSAAVDDLVFETRVPGRVVGFVWDDLNGDGLQDPGEPGLPGVTLVLDGPLLSILKKKTDADGLYDFGPLAPADYSLSVDEDTLPVDYIPAPCDAGDDGLDSDCQPAPVTVAGATVDTDFGYVYDGPDGIIGDFIFDDVNGNNVQDGGDVGIEGATVFLHDADGDIIDSTLSDPNGRYSFTNLAAGEYQVSVDVTTATSAITRGPSICDVGGDEGLDSECGPECVTLGEFLLVDVTTDVTVDFGFGECEDCIGNVDAISVRYLGPGPALVEVFQQEGGTLVFSGELDTNDGFSIFGADPQVFFGDFVTIFWTPPGGGGGGNDDDDDGGGGTKTVTIPTDCSPPLQPGQVFDDFVILAGSSETGGVLCPL